MSGLLGPKRMLERVTGGSCMLPSIVFYKVHLLLQRLVPQLLDFPHTGGG